MRLDHLLSREKVGVVLLSGFQVSLEETNRRFGRGSRQVSSEETGEARQRLQTDKEELKTESEKEA